MDQLFIFFPCFLIFLWMAVKIFKKSKPVNLPPGPKPLPILGNLHHCFGPLPHRILADLAKKYGPLMHLYLGEVPTIVVSSAAVAKEVLNDHDVAFLNRPYLLFSDILNYNCQDIAFSPYNKSWRNLRKICAMELLNPRRVVMYRPIRAEEVMNMARLVSSQKGSVINLTRIVYSMTYTIIGRSAFGKRSKYHEHYIKLMVEIIESMGGFSIVDYYPSLKIVARVSGIRKKLERIQKQVDEVFGSILEEHRLRRSTEPKTRNEGKDDLVDVLLNIQESGEYGGSLSDSNIKGAIYDLFSAGGETSATTVGWVMFQLMKHPELRKRAQDEVRKVFGSEGNVDESRSQELKYLQAVIKETMRFSPSATFLLPRESTEPSVISGYDVPAKTKVLINIFAIGRDPEHWTEPEKFNPDRFLEKEIDYQGKNFAYLPFGAGRRICPGIAFALPNVEMPLAQLLYHFDWELPGQMTPEDLDPSEVYGLTVGLKNELKLVPASIYQHSILNN